MSKMYFEFINNDEHCLSNNELAGTSNRLQPIITEMGHFELVGPNFPDVLF